MVYIVLRCEKIIKRKSSEINIYVFFYFFFFFKNNEKPAEDDEWVLEISIHRIRFVYSSSQQKAFRTVRAGFICIMYTRYIIYTLRLSGSTGPFNALIRFLIWAILFPDIRLHGLPIIAGGTVYSVECFPVTRS